jgi:hypothetical protein
VSTSHCSPPAAVRSRTSAGRGPSSVAMHPHATGARCRARAPQRRSGTRTPPRPREAASHPNRRLIAVAYGAADTLGFSRCARGNSITYLGSRGSRPNRDARPIWPRPRSCGRRPLMDGRALQCSRVLSLDRRYSLRLCVHRVCQLTADPRSLFF